MIGHRRLFDPEELIEWVKSHGDDNSPKSIKKKGDHRKGK